MVQRGKIKTRGWGWVGKGVLSNKWHSYSESRLHSHASVEVGCLDGVSLGLKGHIVDVDLDACIHIPVSKPFGGAYMQKLCVDLEVNAQ